VPPESDLQIYFSDICDFNLTHLSEALDELVGVGEIENKSDEPCIEEILSAVDNMIISQTDWERDASPAAMRRKRRKPLGPNAQAKRWSNLKNEMTLGVGASRDIPYIQTVQSADELEATSPDVTCEPSYTSLVNLFNVEQEQSPQLRQQQQLQRQREDIENCYDSDPEYSKPRRYSRSVRRAGVQQQQQQQRQQKQQQQQKQKQHKKKSKKVPSRKHSTLVFPKGVIRNREGGISEEAIISVVGVMKSATFDLLWHKRDSAPKSVQAWIERGTYLLNQSFVQPKFMWKPTFEPNLATHRKINLEMERFPLLDVSRIDDNPVIDRALYPLAKQPHCFAVFLRKDYYLFQAETIVEKIKIVFGLKILVARLASMLMVRDERAIEEFFEPVDANVPGQAPQFTTMLSAQS